MSTVMRKDLRILFDKVVEFCRVSGVLNESFDETYWTKVVETTYLGQEAEMFPLRSPTLAEMKEVNGRESLLWKKVSEAFGPPSEYHIAYKTDLASLQIQIGLATDRIVSSIMGDSRVLLLLADSIGYKTFQAAELPQVKRKEHLEFITKFFLEHSLYENLVSQLRSGCSDILHAESEVWCSEFLMTLRSLRKKTVYRYQVTFYVNAPVLKEQGPKLIGSLVTDSRNKRLFADHVSDAELNGLKQGLSEVSFLGNINTKVYYNSELSIDVGVKEFEKLYSEAEKFGEWLLSCLRLVIDQEIGIFAIKVRERDPHTPSIRSTYNIVFNPVYSTYYPKRYRYFPDELPRLTAQSAKSLTRILNMQPISKGLDIALRRFNESIDRYFKNNPERLLDIAIALEALYLNDEDSTKELTFRLSLRAARFLGTSEDHRTAIYNTVRDLYGMRSKIAHGETIQNFRAKDQALLDAVNRDAPIILRNTILKMLAMGGEVTDWRNYWRHLVLK